MPNFTLRKTMTFVEDIYHENGPAPTQPRRRAAVVAIVPGTPMPAASSTKLIAGRLRSKTSDAAGPIGAFAIRCISPCRMA